MKAEIAISWHPGIAPIAVFEDGREVFEMRDPDRRVAAAAAARTRIAPITLEAGSVGDSER